MEWKNPKGQALAAASELLSILAYSLQSQSHLGSPRDPLVGSGPPAIFLDFCYVGSDMSRGPDFTCLPQDPIGQGTHRALCTKLCSEMFSGPLDQSYPNPSGAGSGGRLCHWSLRSQLFPTGLFKAGVVWTCVVSGQVDQVDSSTYTSLWPSVDQAFHLEAPPWLSWLRTHLESLRNPSCWVFNPWCEGSSWHSTSCPSFCSGRDGGRWAP